MDASRFGSVIAACLFSFLAGQAHTNAGVPSTNTLAIAKSSFARLGTNKVHYLTIGKGSQTVVLIHGWGGNVMFWAEQVTALQDKARILLIDLPGHGESDKPKLDYTMEYFADGVIAVLRDAGVTKATLVGHSMGTPVICRVYAQAPEKVAGLVSIDGIMRRPPKMDFEQVEKFVAPYRSPAYQEQVKQFIGAMFPNPGTEALRDWTLAQVLATPQYVLSSAMEGMFYTNHPAWDLQKVEVPVLAIHAKSPMWTPEYESYVRSLSTKSDYQSLEGTGHFLMVEKPAEFNEMLVRMLEKNELIK